MCYHPMSSRRKFTWLHCAAASPLPRRPPEAVVQSLLLPSTANRYFAICSTEGDGPGKDSAKWDALFKACHAQ